MNRLLEVDRLVLEARVKGEPRAILRDVSFELYEGEALAMVGESGSGKSMTARTINRLLPSNFTVSGNVRFAGQDVYSLPQHALRQYRAHDVSMIFQDPRTAINPVRKVGDFLTETLRVNDGMSQKAAEQRAVSLLEQVGIGDGDRRMRQYPHELSGGLLQRVMIASVLAGRPRLILADEPTTALDVTTQAEVIGILNRLRHEYGIALLFITHDLELAAAICDSTVVMYAGQIMERQLSDSLHEQPLHPYAAALFQARPDLARRLPELRAIPGQPLAAFDAPAEGCSFADRCAFATAACRTGVRTLEPTPGGLSQCLRVDELRAEMAAAVAPLAEGRMQ